MRFPAAHTSTGRTHIIEDGRKGLRARRPDHNGGATHPVDHGKARDPRLRSEFCIPAFPCPAQGACGLRDCPYRKLDLSKKEGEVKVALKVR